GVSNNEAALGWYRPDLLREHDALVLTNALDPVLAFKNEERGVPATQVDGDPDIDLVADVCDRHNLVALDREGVLAIRGGLLEYRGLDRPACSLSRIPLFLGCGPPTSPWARAGPRCRGERGWDAKA